MKKVWMIGAFLCFMSVVAAFSQEPVPSSATLSADALAAIFDQPTDTRCPAPQGGVDLPGQHPGINMTCTEGSKRYIQYPTCCYNEEVGQCRKNLREDTCVNGSWQLTGFSCNGVNCSPSETCLM